MQLAGRGRQVPGRVRLRGTQAGSRYGRRIRARTCACQNDGLEDQWCILASYRPTIARRAWANTGSRTNRSLNEPKFLRRSAIWDPGSGRKHESGAVSTRSAVDGCTRGLTVRVKRRGSPRKCDSRAPRYRPLGSAASEISSLLPVGLLRLVRPARQGRARPAGGRFRHLHRRREVPDAAPWRVVLLHERLQLLRIANINALRQRASHAWPPTPEHNLPNSDAGRPRSQCHSAALAVCPRWAALDAGAAADPQSPVVRPAQRRQTH